MGALTGHVGMVIGGTSGIGAATARRLAGEGATVVVAGRRRVEGAELAVALGPGASFVTVDVTRDAEVAAAVAHAVERHGRLDSLVLAAGVTGTAGPVADADPGDLPRMTAVHAGGVLAGIRHAAPVMMAQGGGSVVAVGSIAGRLGGWTGLAYAASKAAVLQIVRSAAVELGEHGVRVNSVSPGAVPTGVFGKGAGIDPAVADRTAPALEPAFRAVLRRWQPVPGAPAPDDVAAAAVWLAGDGARFVNGHDLVVDGGLSAGRPLSQALAELPELGAALMAAAGGPG
jgi:NAD(P)-dependent dehydrogenase (short-subunit alcohol dehydrogenase family)